MLISCYRCGERMVKNTYERFREFISDKKPSKLEKHREMAIKLIMKYGKKNGLVLDVGCECGVMSNILEKKGFNVTGIDFLEETIKKARKLNKNIKFICSDIDEFILKNKIKKFDIILLAGVVEYLVNPYGTLRGLRKMLNDEGIMVFTFPNICALRKRLRCLLGKNPEKSKIEINTYTKKEVIELMKRVGLNPIVLSSLKIGTIKNIEFPVLFDTLADNLIFVAKNEKSNK